MKRSDFNNPNWERPEEHHRLLMGLTGTPKGYIYVKAHFPMDGRVTPNGDVFEWEKNKDIVLGNPVFQGNNPSDTVGVVIDRHENVVLMALEEDKFSDINPKQEYSVGYSIGGGWNESVTIRIRQAAEESSDTETQGTRQGSQGAVAGGEKD